MAHHYDLANVQFNSYLCKRHKVETTCPRIFMCTGLIGKVPFSLVKTKLLAASQKDLVGCGNMEAD